MPVSRKHSGLGMALVIGMILSMAAPRAQAGCSDATLAGTWAFTTTGTIILPTVGPAPVAAVGRIRFDGKGNIGGKQTRSVGGQVADETFSGTYKVDGDCTATFTVQVFLDGVLVRTSSVYLTLDSDQREIRAIFTSSFLPDNTPLPSVLTAQAKRL